MKDADIVNEVWEEACRENFYEALSQRDWSLCRAVLADMEEKHIDTRGLRKEMNTAMDDDVAEQIW